MWVASWQSRASNAGRTALRATRHLTSDEAIEEGIVNEYTFTDGGLRFG